MAREGRAPLDPGLLQYLRMHLPEEEAFLGRLRAEAETAGLPPISIPWEQAFFLRLLLRATGARRVLEVGTLGGYSALAMALGLPEEGWVDTLEVDPERADFARDQVRRSPVPGRVRVHQGDATELLPDFQDGAYDAAFLDADKANYPRYLEHALRLVRSGGLILADNAFAFGQLLDAEPEEPGVEAIRAFNTLVPRTAGLRALILPLGDGLWFGVRD